MSEGTLKLAIDGLLEIQKRRAELEAEVSALKKNEEVAKAAVADAIAELAGMAGVPLDDFKIPVSGFNWKVVTKKFYNVPRAEQDAFFSHLDEVGLGDIVSRSVNRSTLSKAMNDLMAEDPDIMTRYNISNYEEVTISKVSTK